MLSSWNNSIGQVAGPVHKVPPLATHTPDWVMELTTEDASLSESIRQEVLQARAVRFQNLLTPQIDRAETSNIGSRVYLLHTPVEPVPAQSSDLVAIVTPAVHQAYMAQQRSNIYTDLRLKVDRLLSAKEGVPISSLISVLYPGGSIKTVNGHVLSRGVGTGSAPLDIGKTYLVFLTYEKRTDSFNILRAWDLTGSRPAMLDHNGGVRNTGANVFESDEALLANLQATLLKSQLQKQ